MARTDHLGRSDPGWEHSMWAGIAVFRWAAWVWLTVVAAADLRNGEVARPEMMLAVVALTLGVTMAATVAMRRSPQLLSNPRWLGAELVVGAAVVFGDWWVYGVDGTHSQSLGSIWPLAGVLALGVRAGPLAGVLAGVGIGVASLAGELVFGVSTPDVGQGFGLAGQVVLYGLGGGVAGAFARRLRSAENEVAMARARDEVARTLHDGVLQTLAVIQRRVDDPSLVELARDQERELRDYLFAESTDAGGAEGARRTLDADRADGAGRTGGRGRASDATTAEQDTSLLAALRRRANRAEKLHRIKVDLAVVPGVGEPPTASVTALADAVAECLTNAAKHGPAQRCTVFVDADDDGWVCTVKDDGAGFDPATTPEGAGLRLSVRDRLGGVGGACEIDGRPGRGTEITMRIPARTSRSPGPAAKRQ